MKIMTNVNELEGRRCYIFALSKVEAEKYNAPENYKYFIVQFVDEEKETGLLFVKAEEKESE